MLVIDDESTVVILLRPALLPLYLKIPQSINAFKVHIDGLR